MKAAYGEVKASVEGHVAVLEIDRPPNNHVTVQLIRDLADALDDVDSDPALRVSLLCSAGRVFCGGADLVTPGEAGVVDSTKDLYAQAARLFGTKKPIVAAIQGAAVGADFALLMRLELATPADEAKIKDNLPRLQDAFILDLNEVASSGDTFDQERAKRRMMASSTRILGDAHIVKDVVFERVLERKVPAN